jgi:hypothetical protein
MYSQSTGKSLREIFGKVSIDDDDKITKFQFAEKMSDISRQLDDDMDPQTIERLARELNIGDNLVSFSSLQKLYSEHL